MHRRRLMRLAAGLPVLAGVGGAGPAAVVGPPASRARPSDPAWPSAAEWEGLKRRVGGNLLKPSPLLAPCETDPKSAECRALFKSLQNPFFIGDQPSGTQVSGYLDAWTPAPSAYVVAAHTAGDVAAAVNFARRHSLRLVVKGGGHSYQGTSNAPDSLLIWTRPMREVRVVEAFVPKGAPSSQAPVPAVTAEAGAVWLDLYDAVTTKGGRYVQGGGCTTVGVAGHIQSGGFGSFSKGFGTASGNLLEAEVVTADGAIRTVNAHLNPDLFWALKGGGGGSIGVVTKVSVRTHDLPENFGFASLHIKAVSDDAFGRLVSRFLEFYRASLMNAHWGEQAAIQPGNVLKISMVSQGLDADRSQQVWRPFLDWVAASPADFTAAPALIGVRPARGWWDVEGMRQAKSGSMQYDDRPGAPPTQGWWTGDQSQVSAFLHGYDSIWLPASLLEAPSRERLAGALVAASRRMEVQLHFNKGLAGAAPEAIAGARDTAMSPDALSAFALAIISTGGPPAYMSLMGFKPDMTFAHRNATAVASAAAALREVAPTAGSYLSESNYFNDDWRRAYWGSNYPRLRGVKAKYDPDGLFFVHHGVGSEAWSADGFQRIV
jgi:FAD/FMN-containing dehydrogenase